MRVRKLIAVVVVFAVLLVAAATGTFLLGSGFLGGRGGSASTPVCPAVAPVKVGSITVPAGPVAGYCQDRLINAAQIMNAARSLGIGTHTQAIGVMTAMGESGLRVLNYGDAAGADSRGLFQQRANGAWGSLSDRMDPYISALNFFSALVQIPGWKTLSPGQAAHKVQVNSDPNHYDPYWARAQVIVRTLSGRAG